MRRTLLLLLASCATAQRGGSLACPEGAQVRVEGDHVTSIERCVLRGTETNHGPYVVRDRSTGAVVGEESWVRGKQHGLFRSFDPSGAVILEEEYEQGMLQRSIEWRGGAKIRHLTQLPNGSRLETTWDPEGHPLSETTQDAQGGSVVRRWAPNGVQLELTRIGDGKREHSRAYPDGTPAAEEHWAANQPAGTWRYFHPNGKPSLEIDYAAGKEIARRAFDETGRARPLAEVGAATCASDAECRLGYAGAECCPQSACPGVVSLGQLERFKQRCGGIDCGPAQANAPCLGSMRLHPACVAGMCASR